ncbi:MAG: hypothetical protein H0T79_08570 [Deltaproteobacteria bacterium]|nr:hypothetical protein [Deltaproteobacteria bacterium]
MYRLLFILVLAPTGACVPDSGDEGILITKNVKPADGCLLTASVDEAFLGHGTMSSVLLNDYLFIAQMKSRITATDIQIDQRTIFTEGANVDLTFPNSTLFSADELAEMKASGLTHFKSLFSAPIAPNGGITDATFMIIPEALVARIGAKDANAQSFDPAAPRFALEVVAAITVTGTLAGDAVDSNPYSYPVTITNRDVVQVAGTCPLPLGTVPLLGNACGDLQDAPVTCCTDGDQLVCPATVDTMPPA